MKSLLWRLILISIITVVAVYIVRPNASLITKNITKRWTFQPGLDLKGGVQLTYELNVSSVDDQGRGQAIEGVVKIIDRRINSLGVTEPTIHTSKFIGKDAVIVELPGITNVQEAIDLIGKTAQLEFHEQTDQTDTSNGFTPGWNKTDLTGADLIRADVQFESGGGQDSLGQIQRQPVVSLKFNDVGAKKFAEITRKNLNKPVAIILDNQPLSAPTVQTAIEDGNAIITGDFEIREAKLLVLQLNSGALPVPITLIAQRTIGATLGQQSIAKSLIAGIVGIILVITFMIANYRLSGVVASIALLIYSTIVLALFKAIPVTLTLAGIAGFVLSIGAAVDANILIFERLKEELRQGIPLKTAIEIGFRRAWHSIRDSNVSSLITAAVLFWFGTGSVRGFALVLAIGILVSMFTAITVSRTLLQIFLREKVKS